MAPNDEFANDIVDITFDADDDVSLPRLNALTNALMQMLREVEHGVAPGEGVQWIVNTLSKQSPLHLELRPVTSDPAATGVTRRLARTVNEGMRTIQERAHRPDHFTDRALEKAKELVQVAQSNKARLRIGSSLALTGEFVAHVDELLGSTVTSIGTVEGTLEALNVHGTRRVFVVYDALIGTRVLCNFGHRIDAAAIGAAAERRVAVHGEIKYREGGEIVNVTVQSFEVFPSDDELPSADDVRGILEG
jgi:hypothetical protein